MATLGVGLSPGEVREHYFNKESSGIKKVESKKFQQVVGPLFEILQKIVCSGWAPGTLSNLNNLMKCQK